MPRIAGATPGASGRSETARLAGAPSIAFPRARMDAEGHVVEVRMTRRTNARVAGVTFLLYIALGIPAMILSGRATHGEGIAAKLATLAQHATDLRVAFLLDLVTCFTALVLAV